MPFRDVSTRREYQRQWDRSNRPRREETHTRRAGFARRRSRFVAIDGEGYSVADGSHKYAWLAASDGNRTVRVYNPHGLLPRDCWEFLLSLPREFGPAIYVGFALGYDFEYWLPTREDRLRLLDSTARCRYGPYRFLWWPRKRFEVARLEGDCARVRVDDVFGYFATSFEHALNDWRIQVRADDRRILAEGKRRRRSFGLEDFESGFIDRYNAIELRLLAILVRLLNDARDQVGIHTSDFYSPANLATELFKQHGVKVSPAPPAVEEAAYSAFFGGRIEAGAFGTYLGRVYMYDINRAYPYAMASLPDLSQGSWVHGTQYVPGTPLSLYHTRRDFPEGWRYYPLPWRDTNGAVYYPPRGSGWIWGPELDPDWVRRGWVVVDEAWHFIALGEPSRPFEWQAELYRKSLELKARGEYGQATALKLGQNSAYGKLAQRTSARTEVVDGVRVRARPTFHSPCYAGLITSLTRARLWRALGALALTERAGFAESPVVSFCTDGFFSLEPLLDSADCPLEFAAELEVSDRFGALKTECYDGLQILQSGVYRLLKGPQWDGRGRGFANRRVPWEAIVQGWQRGLPSIQHGVEAFIGHRRARAQPRLTPRTWVHIPREIRLGAVGKRHIAPPPVYTSSTNPATRLYWTRPERDVEFLAESASNVPEFTRRPQAGPGETAEDLADLGWTVGETEERTS